MEAVFKSDFLKFFTAFQIFTRGKWKMDLFMNRIRFNFKNRPTGTTVFLGWKLLVEVVFENGAFWASKLLFEAHDYVTMAVKINNTHSRKQLNWKMAQNSREF